MIAGHGGTTAVSDLPTSHGLAGTAGPQRRIKECGDPRARSWSHLSSHSHACIHVHRHSHFVSVVGQGYRLCASVENGLPLKYWPSSMRGLGTACWGRLVTTEYALRKLLTVV